MMQLELLLHKFILISNNFSELFVQMVDSIKSKLFGFLLIVCLFFNLWKLNLLKNCFVTLEDKLKFRL